MVSVTRSVVDTLANAADPDRWLAQLAASLTDADRSLLVDAFSHARTLYANQVLPLTGEDLFSHAVAAAAIVCELDLLPDAIAATLLFAVPDIRQDWPSWLSGTFNPAVAQLVYGVNKVRRLTELIQVNHLGSLDERTVQVESLRKMLLAMVSDIRVVLIKLAWRTQTMHYLTHCDRIISQKIAQETMDIFAPLANRLGVWQIKWELEDLGFRYLEPENYKKIAQLLDERRLERLNYIEEVVTQLRDVLKKSGLHAEVAGRPKHIYSIWRKMRSKNLAFSEVYDIRAVRVLVDTIADCYAALGLIHHIWQPIPGEFDDYISHPKTNDYRSLHTAVLGPQERGLEVQIRTFKMHEHAEFGVAAHWRYKEGGQSNRLYEEKIAWLRQLLDWREEVSDRNGLPNAFKTELFSDTLYVLTPVGKVLDLPQGATPIDFAYAVHTDLGHRCRGAKVNGHIVPLSTPLENGQRVEILASKEGGPSVNWLHEGWVKSSRAINKIRQYIRQQHGDVVREAGRQLFERELTHYALTNPNFGVLSEKLGFASMDELYAALGHGEISRRLLAQALQNIAPAAPKEMGPEDFINVSKGGHDAQGILVAGVDNLMTLLARCCKPVPPDALVGFVTKGRGISIHRAHCPTLQRLSQTMPERLIAVEWGEQKNSLFPIDIHVLAQDRSGLLRDISEVFARDKVNVVGVQTQVRDQRVRIRFTIEVRQAEEVMRVLVHMLDIPSVLSAQRE